MARSTREQTEATRERIIAAAHARFAERGVEDVALEEVARDAGVTRGAVYHHFGSRQGMFGAVHRRVQERVAVEIEAATSGVTDPWEALELGCRAFLTAAVAPEVRRILLVDAPAVLGWREWRETDAAHSGRLLGEVLRELVDRGVVAVGSVEAAQALLSGAMNDAALWAATLSDPHEGVGEAWQVLRRMLAALRSTGPAAG